MATVKEIVTARGKTSGKASPTPSTSTIDSRPGSSAKVHGPAPTSIGGLHVGSNAKDKGKEALPGAIDTGNDPTNPHELIGWVEKILGKLEANYDEMSTQFLERLTTLSTRVDSLERSIQDLTQGATATLTGDVDGTFPTTIAEQGETS